MKHRNITAAEPECRPVSRYDAFDGSWSVDPLGEVPSVSLLRDMRHRIELIAIIMMALAGLLAAWSAYEAHRWYGISTEKFGEANIQLSSSVQYHIQSDRQILVDLMDFQDWLTAYQRGDHQKAEEVESRFSDQFRALFKIWRKLPAAAQPGNPSPHGVNSQFADEFAVTVPDSPSELLIRQAKSTFATAEDAGHHAHDFLVVAGLFGFALILGAISLRMNSTGMQIGVLLLSELFTLAGVAMIVGLPAHFGG